MPHKTMDGQARAAYESQSLQLRADLKKWEGDWATAHGGQKPGRDDIKQNPDIAQKYKQYNKLRDILAGKIPAPPEIIHGHQQRKRTQSDALLPPQTPSKRARPAQTPRKTQVFSQTGTVPLGAQTPSAAAATPSMNRTLPSPVVAVPTSISPTPQKDGRVLGLFDLLAGTPSRSNAAVTATETVPVAGTPSKQRAADIPLPTLPLATTPTTARFASTPQSKRTLFHATTTPSHSRHANNTTTARTTTQFKTPSTNRIARPQSTPTSATPSFLRRRTVSLTATATLSCVDEQDECGSDDEAWKKVGPLRLPRKLGLGRTLSSVVAGLRKMEEEAFGDEEEVLREMEMAAGGGGSGAGSGLTKAGVNRGVEAGNGGAEVGGDRQLQAPPGHDLAGNNRPSEGPAGKGERAVKLLSAFDDEALYDSPDEANTQDSQPLRQFKKRGQKRTTRLVNMRPTRAKRPAQPQPADEHLDDDVVPETQFTTNSSNPPPAVDEADLRLSDIDSASLASFDGSDADSDPEEGAKAARKKAATITAKDGKNEDGKSEGVVKRAVRKVKATAHANFKRLKLRNTGAKGGPGYNSRFRRRR
ncbi:hypothetical protein VTI74DRAFT_9486 [Chaetomium olivicolor]